MSTDLTRYLLEATLIWASFLLFYRLAVAGTADWRLHRRLLLLFLVGGALLPLLPKLSIGTVADPVSGAVDMVGYVGSRLTAAPEVAAAGWKWSDLLPWIWGGGTVVTLLVFAYQTAAHLPDNHRDDGKSTERFAGFPVVRSRRVAAPFATFGRIYLPDDLSPALERAALLHEATHLRNGHQREKLLLLVIAAVFWFHPLPWIYLRRLTAVHEYEADAAVLREMEPARYGKLLVSSVLHPRLLSGLFSSSLQKRIAMFCDRSLSTSFGARRWTSLAVLALALVFTCSVSTATVTSTSNDAARTATAISDTTWQTEFLDAVYYPEEAYEGDFDEMARFAVDLEISYKGELTHIFLKRVDLQTKRPEFPTLTVVGDREETRDLLISVEPKRDHFYKAVEHAILQIRSFPIAERDGQPVMSRLKFDVFFFPQKSPE